VKSPLHERSGCGDPSRRKLYKRPDYSNYLWNSIDYLTSRCDLGHLRSSVAAVTMALRMSESAVAA
jgi:hypothetical protein